MNRILENHLRAYTSLEQMNWVKLLPVAAFAYSNSKKYYNADVPLQNPIRLRFDIADNVTKEEAPAARDQVERLHELRELLRDEIWKAQENQAKYYDQWYMPMAFKRGDFVKLSTNTTTNRFPGLSGGPTREEWEVEEVKDRTTINKKTHCLCQVGWFDGSSSQPPLPPEEEATR